MSIVRLVPASGDAVEISKDPTVVGRDPSCDLVLSDGSVSRKHARIEKRGSTWAVVDQGSANGTFVDSQRVADGVLHHGQELRFGAIGFRVEIGTGTEAELSATVIGEPGATVIQPVPLAPPVAPPRPSPPAPPAAAPPPPPPRPAAPPPPPPSPHRPPPPPPGAGRPAGYASPVPPMPAGAPPVRKGKSPLFWIGTGCCGCLTLVLLLVALIVSMAWFGTRGAVDAVHGALAEIKQGEIESAYSRLSRSYRGEMSLGEFRRLIAAHPALRDNADASFFPPRGSAKVVNDTAELTGVLTATTGEREEATFELIKEDGAWKISAIRFAGETSAPPPERSPEAKAPLATGSPLAIETTAVQKQAVGERTKVTIKVRVKGFSVRPEGSVYRIDLAGDLETLAPDGERIGSLSKTDFHRLNDTTSSATGNYADFTTDLTLAPTSPQGTYTVRLTIRDLVGGGQGTSQATFDLP